MREFIKKHIAEILLGIAFVLILIFSAISVYADEPGQQASTDSSDMLSPLSNMLCPNCGSTSHFICSEVIGDVTIITPSPSPPPTPTPIEPSEPEATEATEAILASLFWLIGLVAFGTGIQTMMIFAILWGKV